VSATPLHDSKPDANAVAHSLDSTKPANEHELFSRQDRSEDWASGSAPHSQGAGKRSFGWDEAVKRMEGGEQLDGGKRAKSSPEVQMQKRGVGTEGRGGGKQGRGGHLGKGGRPWKGGEEKQGGRGRGKYAVGGRKMRGGALDQKRADVEGDVMRGDMLV